MPAQRAAAGRSATRPGRPRSASMRSAWPSAPSAMPWAGARPSPAGPRAPPSPGPAASTTRKPPTEAHPPRLRPGRAPIRRPDPLIATSIRPHAPVDGRLTGDQPPNVARSAPLGGSQTLIISPAAHRSGPTGLHHALAGVVSPRSRPHSPAHHRPGDRQARSTTHQPPSAHHHHPMSPCPLTP